MKRLVVIWLVIAAFAASASATPAAGPVTKQNGSSPVFTNFTSICRVTGYVLYGKCGGSVSTFDSVAGRIDAVQPKAGVYNLSLSFSHLQPGALYRLWGNRSGAAPVQGNNSGFFSIDTRVASLDGTVGFDYQTTSPTNLGFDLNVLSNPSEINGITLVTTYWSNQWLQVMTGGLLSAP
jgi:hypothetical protein